MDKDHYKIKNNWRKSSIKNVMNNTNKETRSRPKILSQLLNQQNANSTVPHQTNKKIRSKPVILSELLKRQDEEDNVRFYLQQPSDDASGCRVCGKFQKIMLPLYSGKEMENKLSNIINENLPIKVTPTGDGRRGVCSTCADTLLKWSELKENCIETERLLGTNERKHPDNTETDLKNTIYSVKLLFQYSNERPSIETLESIEAGLTSRPSYFCQQCCFEFFLMPMLNLHFRVCNELQCVHCQHQFESLKDNYDHQLYCHKLYDIPPDCAEISNSKKRSDDLSDPVLHDDRVTGSDDTADSVKIASTFSCDVCEATFKDGGAYDSHVVSCAACVQKTARSDGIRDSNDEIKNCLQAYGPQTELLFSMFSESNDKVDLRCRICGDSINGSDSLESHLRERHRDTLAIMSLANGHLKRTRDTAYSCSVCLFNSREVSVINAHLYRYHLACECKICGVKLASFNDRCKHIRSKHSDEDKEYCSICKKRIDCDEWLTHRRWHLLEEEYVCEQCGRASMGLKRHSCHLKYHTSETVLCPDCGSYISKPRFYHHSRIHIADKARPELSGASCDTRLRLVTRKRPEGKVRCPDCKRLIKEDYVQLHALRHRERGAGLARPHCCHLCKTKFAAADGLEMHVRVRHADELPHCAKCGVDFASLKEFYDHKSSKHPIPKPTFKCCDKEYTKFSQVEQHFVDVHREGKCSVTRLLHGQPTQFIYNLVAVEEEDGGRRVRTQCGHCDKVFRSQDIASSHIKNVHVTRNDYKCSHCDYTTKIQSSLIAHENYRHLRSVSYGCRFCDKSFFCQRIRGRHEKSHIRTDYTKPINMKRKL